MTLLHYRLRPIPSLLMGGTAACWLLLTDHFGPRFGVGTEIDLLQVAVQSSECSLPGSSPTTSIRQQRCSPRRRRTYRRAVAVRVMIWLALSAIALSVTAQYWPGGTPRPVVEAALSALVLAAGVSLTTGARLGSHLGGAVAIGILLVAAVLVASIHSGPTVASASPDSAVHAGMGVGHRPRVDRRHPRQAAAVECAR